MLTPITEIQELFKVSQEGSMDVANVRGISLESLLASLMFSTFYCGIQIALFYYLQRRYPQFYDKYDNAGRETLYRGNQRKQTLFQWCLNYIGQKKDIVKLLDIEQYRQYGLDSYLFLRFIKVCLYFFVGVSLVCIPVLIPVNYVAETTQSANSGLDLISIININSDVTYRYIFHFLVTIFIVFWFHYILIHEINFYIHLKSEFNQVFSKYDSGQRFLKTMYIENIDTVKYPSVAKLKEVFESFIPDCVDDIYPIYYSERLVKLCRRRAKLRIELERQYWQMWKYRNGEIKKMPENTMKLPIKILNSDYEITTVGISYTVNKRQYLEKDIKNLSYQIRRIQNKFANNEKLLDPLLVNDKVFIRFKCIWYNQIMNQIEVNISKKEYKLGNFKLIDINPRDVDWENVFMFHDIPHTNKNFINNAKECFIFIISIIVIVCWVIPISCIGTLLQLDFLTMMIPTIRWIKYIPQILQDFISWVLPTIILTFFTSFGLIMFRYLIGKKRNITSANIELNIQTWVFVFLFFQLFVVITISSGFIIILQKLILNPISIPMIVAIDFPKAAIFFTLFFMLKGLSLVGNNVLQFYDFVKKVVVDDWIMMSVLYSKTEKEIINEDRRYLYEGVNYWGQVYPTFSVYGCIGIVYSIISPAILIFCCINFTLDLIGYKYSVKYTLNRTNKSETYGQLYIKALKQMYAGIYSLEFFEIGLFISVKDSKGDHSCLVLCVLLTFILLITLYTHLELNKEYERGLCGLPNSVPLTKEERAHENGVSVRERYLPWWLRIDGLIG